MTDVRSNIGSTCGQQESGGARQRTSQPSGRWRLTEFLGRVSFRGPLSLTGSMTSTALVFALSLVLIGESGRADDDFSASLSETNRVPEEDWTPVPRELLQRFLHERAEPADIVPAGGPYIERITYRGELEADDLSFHGSLEGVIRSDEAYAALDLQRVSMYFGDLRWRDGLAEWGTTDEGRTVLLVPGDTGMLTGRWSLAHRDVDDRIEFRVRIPPAAASRFELSLPADWRLTSSTGTVFPPAANEPGRSTWAIELGRRYECLWTLERVDAPQAAPLLLTEEQSHVYSISEDRCQVRAGFDVRVLRGPVRELRFRLPEGFQYSGTTYSGSTGNVSLPARQEVQDGTDVLIVPCPELSVGLLRTVEIDGTIPTIVNAPWQLPTILLSDARTMQGTRRLRVEAPLAVSALQPALLRQTDATFSESGVDWSFEELSDHSALEVHLVIHKPRIAARVACRIEPELGDLRCDALVRLNTQSGTWYATEFQVPPDWDVLDVVPADGPSNSAIAYWRVLEQGDGRRLRVEFRQSASLQSPKSIRIHSRARRNPDLEESCAAPVPVPVDVDDCRVLLVIPGDNSPNLVSTDPLAMTEKQESAIGAWSAELDSLGVPAASYRQMRFFESVRAFDTGRLQFAPAVESNATSADPREDAPSVTHESSAALSRHPTLSLTLKSRASTGGAETDRHEAVFDVVSGLCSERMLFGLAPECSILSVLVDGEPRDYSQQGDQIALADLEADVRTIEIHFAQRRSPSGWRSGRILKVVPPTSARELARFQWEVRMPHGYRIARLPSHAFLVAGPQPLPLSERILGPFFDVDRRFRSAESRTEAESATFTSISAPEALDLELWNTDVIRTRAWVVFLATVLVALLLRASFVRTWQPVAMALMFISATLAALLTTVPAVLCGSIFTGVVLAGLLPRRLTAVWSPAESESPGLPDISAEDRLSWTATSLLVLASCLSLEVFCAADDEPTRSGVPAESGRARVLVPHGDHAARPVVYVDDMLARELAAWLSASNFRPQFLLRKASYSVPADAGGLVRAEMDVLVTTESPRVAVRLPFAEVIFRSSEDCLVNGVPTPIRPSIDGRGMIVEILNNSADSALTEGIDEQPEFRNVTLTLQFRPRQNNDGTALEAGVPVITDSQLVFEGHAADRDSPRVFRAGTARDLVDGREIEMGPVRKLHIGSPATERPAEREPQAAGQAVSLVVLQPQHAWIRTRLEVRRPQSTFGPDPLMPQVIELEGLCNVREVASRDLQAFHVRYRDPDRTVVELIFDRFDGSDAVIHLDYTRPPATDGEWRFPDIIEVDGSPLTQHVLGVDSSPGFVIDADQTAADADGVRVIPPMTFEERVPDDSGWARPDVAYQLTSPFTVPVELSPLETERSAGIDQTVSVGDDRTGWEAALSMNVVGVPATQHHIQLSSSIHVESVSVVQDEAERLLSWSQNGVNLVVFLTGDRTGAQLIELRGRLLVADDSLQEVPTIRIPDATIGNLDTVIENRSTGLVELLDAGGGVSSVLTPDDGSPEPTSSQTFDADSPDAPARFRVQPRQAQGELSAVVAVSNAGLSVGLLPLAGAEGVHDWDLTIPAAWGGEFSVEPPEALIRQHTDAAGETVLTLRTGDPAELLTLTTPLSPPAGGHWTLPTPTVRNGEITACYLAVATDLPLVADTVGSAGVEPEAIWRSWIESKLGRGVVRVVRAPIDNCTLRRPIDTRSREATGLLAETILFSSVDGPGAGRTMATVMTHQRELVLEFAVPTGVELLSGVFNGVGVEPEWIDNHTARFQLVADAPIGLRQFALNWRSQASRDGFAIHESIPRLTFPQAECRLSAIVPSSTRQVVVREGMSLLAARELHFQRAECLVRILQQVVPGHIEFDASSHTVTNGLALQLTRHLQTLEQESLDAEELARLAAIQVEWSGISSLMGSDWEVVAADAGPITFPEEAWIVSTTNVAGLADPTADAWEVVSLSRGLIQGITVMAILSGFLATLMLLRKHLPARMRKLLAERDSMLGAAVLGLLWWLLLPLGLLGMVVCVTSLVWEVVSVLRTGIIPRHPA